MRSRGRVTHESLLSLCSPFSLLFVHGSAAETTRRQCAYLHWSVRLFAVH